MPAAARGARIGRAAGRLEGREGPRGRRHRRAGARAKPAAEIHRFTVLEDDSELSGDGHQEPQGREQPDHERPRGDDGVHRQGARGVRARDQADRAARLRRRHAPAGRPTSSSSSSTSRSRSTTRSCRWRRSTSSRTPRGLTADRRRDREHRRLQRRQRPRREPAHRRPADRAEADLADPGLGLARQAGAPPGPDRGGRRPDPDDPVPPALLPRARPGRGGRAADLRGSSCSRWSS